MARILHNNRVKFPKDFFSIVLYTNMAAMTSSENHLYIFYFGFTWPFTILGDPKAVSRAGRKGVTKVFKHGRKSPWVPTLTGPFPNGKANAGSWLGTKMLCIIVPNRRTVSPELFSWVRTRPLLSRHSCPVRSPSFPNQTKELPMSRKTFRMLSAGAI